MSQFITSQPAVQLTSGPSEEAHRRMLSRRGEPLFLAAWRRVLMLHFEVDAAALQRDVPFQLDLYQGRAFVSLVAFSMEDMRPRFGGRLGARLLRPIATHHFLNVRTYVVHRTEPGIHFLAEWLSSRLAAMLGPVTFGLPYRYGHVAYDFSSPQSLLQGRVVNMRTHAALAFHGKLTSSAQPQPCAADSLTEWLMERYTAFNSAGGIRRYFRVWHPPWPQCPASVTLDDLTLFTARWPWFKEARLVGANYSPGFDSVWMGRPHW